MRPEMNILQGLNGLTVAATIVALSTQSVQAIDDTGDPSALLARAQSMLVKSAAAPLSKVIRNEATATDRQALQSITTDALAQLAQYDAAIKFEDQPKADATRFRLLSAMAKVFDAIARLDKSKDAVARLTDAAIELELYVDDPDKHIAEAARLWQGLAYRLAGKPERSLKILHPILKPGTRSPIDLYGRFERCRALSAAGRHVAAVALAVRITEVAHVWPKGAGPAFTDAHTAARRLTADAYRAWAADLTKAGETERAATAQRRAEEIDAEIKDALFDSFNLEATVVGLETESTDG